MTLTAVHDLIEYYKASGKGELKHVNFPLILPIGVIRDIVDGCEDDKRLFIDTTIKRDFTGFGYMHNDTRHEFLSLSTEFIKAITELEENK